MVTLWPVNDYIMIYIWLLKYIIAILRHSYSPVLASRFEAKATKAQKTRELELSWTIQAQWRQQGDVQGQVQGDVCGRFPAQLNHQHAPSGSYNCEVKMVLGVHLNFIRVIAQLQQALSIREPNCSLE